MVRAPKTWVGHRGESADALKPGGSSTGASQHVRARPVVAHSGDAPDRHRPAGLGLDSEDVRRRMVERLRAGGPHHSRVLDALASVPRHHFVDAALVTQAYEDTSLPIGHGQTISKPSVVARMLDVLMEGATARTAGHLGRVLEIGTGCGYQAAVLCCLGRNVVSVERIRGLHDKARDLVAPLRMNQLRLVYGDGMLGHPPNAPYDSIIAAACGASVPESWLTQLAVGGRLISPVDGASKGQMLVVVDRHEGGYQRTEYEAVQFVPLKSGSI
ncbi:MAG: protein-L-isoaspartate(D-aspartate) O-methyltransferase [Rhizobacter sp.]